MPLHAHLPVLSDLYLPLASLSSSKVVPLRQLRQLAFLGLPTGKPGNPRGAPDCALDGNNLAITCGTARRALYNMTCLALSREY